MTLIVWLSFLWLCIGAEIMRNGISALPIKQVSPERTEELQFNALYEPNVNQDFRVVNPKANGD